MARVLVVDDEHSIRETIGEFLAMDGHEVLTAGDGPAAMALLHDNDIDVVVSDIVMPRLSGMQLLEFIHKTNDDIQVIMMTGEPTIETASRSVRERAFDYLAKPISGKTIRQTVANAARVRLLQTEKRALEEENSRHREHLELAVAERTVELARTNDELQATLGRLRESLDKTTRAMSLTIEKRDPYTAGHQTRVAQLAVAIAREMKLPGDELAGVRTAALLHDLGKISIPAEILAKPTRLTAEETALIRTHPRVGFEILATIDFLWPVADVIVQHHERWDGSGYPDGLKGENILLGARIIGVSDVVEAMSQHRPYRAALGVQTALAHIAENGGVIYDAAVTAVCLKVFAEGFVFLPI
jgi:putative nucleotidyltransferase with HDIG domain